jgi:hypothetical protein
MRWRHFIVPALVVLSASACSRAGGNSSGSAEQDPGPTLSTPSLFSYQAPSGWSSQVAGGLELGGFPQAVGPASNNFTPDITFITNGHKTVEQFAKMYTPRLVDLIPRTYPMKLVDQKPFMTAAGVAGIRLHSIDPASPPIAEQFSYVFSNPDGTLFQFACACAPADADHYAPIFDASMKTVIILQPGG